MEFCQLLRDLFRLIPCDTVTLEQSLLDERLTNLNVSVNTASKIRKNTVQPWELDDIDEEDDDEQNLISL